MALMSGLGFLLEKRIDQDVPSCDGIELSSGVTFVEDISSHHVQTAAFVALLKQSVQSDLVIASLVDSR